MARFPKLGWVALAIIVAHVVWLVVWPSAAWSDTVSEQFQLLAGLLACYCCWSASKRSRFFAKNFWGFSALTFALWSLGSLMGSIHDVLPNASADPPLIVVLTIFLSTAPMFVAALLGGGEDDKALRWDAVLDVAQLLVLIIAIHLMLVAIPNLTQGPKRGAINRLFLLASWRAALALALALRAGFSKSRVVRRLLAPVAGAMSLFTLGSALGNYIDRFGLWSRVQWFELSWTIPFCMVAMAAATWHEPTDAPPAETGSAGMAPTFIIYLPALAIPLLLLKMYSTVVFEQIVVGLFAMLISVVFFTLRVFVAQRRQKQTLRRLSTSELRYRTLFEHNMAAVYRSTLDGRMLECNQAWLDMFGYTMEEIRNVSTTILYPGGREERDRMLERIRRGGPHIGVEAVLRRKDGSVVNTVGNRTITVDENGNQVLEGTLIDVSQRRSLERQLQQAQKMESLGMMAGGVAHDFNNMLTVINGYSAMQLDTLKEGDPLREYAVQIKSACDRASGLTRQLLAFSRQQVLEERTVNLNQLARDFEKFMKRLIGEDIEIRTAFSQDLGSVRVDPGQMEQVLMNLVVNARDAMPKGGTITIETANVFLDATSMPKQPLVSPGPYVRLSVVDTGGGMSEETLTHIFEPFFTTKPLGKGTGLGLATTYGIVKQSQGYVDVQSVVGMGSRFDVYLPMLMRPVSPSQTAKAPATARGVEGILLVEDNQQLRAMAKTLLESYGYTVFVVGDAAQVEDVCAQHGEKIQLLLTDVVLPRTSGAEVAQAVIARLPRVKVIYMSGFASHAGVDRGALEATGTFLQKPFPPAVLAAKVREVLDQSVAGQA